MGRRVIVLLRITTMTLVAIYTLGMVALVVVWKVAPERTWWLALANILAPHLFLPLLLIVPLTLLLRSRTIGMMAGLLVLLYVGQFSSQVLPHTFPQVVQAEPAPGALRVITFNQLYRNESVQAALAILQAQQGDIIVLQELSSSMAHAIEQDAQVVARYPYRELQPESSAGGMGVLSRLPLTKLDATIVVPIQVFQIAVADKQITFINVHPFAPDINIRRLRNVAQLKRVPLVSQLPMIFKYDTRQRNQALQAILQDIDARQGALIVAGDFNTADRDPLYAQIAARMHDVYAETSWGFGRTFPNPQTKGDIPIPFPLVRIDYIWTSGAIDPIASHVICGATGSDHCMVVADVRVK